MYQEYEQASNHGSMTKFTTDFYVHRYIDMIDPMILVMPKEFQETMTSPCEKCDYEEHRESPSQCPLFFPLPHSVHLDS